MNASQHPASTVEVEPADFEAEVLASKQPMLAVFCAPWSRPCQFLESALDEVATVCGSQLRVVKVNADNCPDLGIWYGIQAIPTLLFFVNGSLCAKVVGVTSKDEILAKLELLGVTRDTRTESRGASRNKDD
jgi:thioredoxin 1